jgi:glycosyltransferase involved in cell wall biosynthesis
MAAGEPVVISPVAPRVSFIMPARNEERFIGSSIASIRAYCPPELLCEIIVVDHGSTDRTRDIAAAAGAVVLQPTVATIAALRNAGARVAKGNTYVFLDADVTLTEAWHAGADAVLRRVLQEPMCISGFNCDAPDSGNWFLKYWFRELAKEQSPVAIGSAHLIMAKALFDRMGGFDASLQTGEDYALCTRARSMDAQILPQASLRTIHHGYPVTISAFVRRERWHGLGDVASVRRALRSKVVWMTAVFLGLHLGFLSTAFIAPIGAAISLVLLLGLLYVSVRVRFRGMRGIAILVAMTFFYLYYCGRSLSFFQVHARGSR